MKTEVKKHPRKTKTGRTSVREHIREVSGSKHEITTRDRFTSRKIQLKSSYSDIEELNKDYLNNGYSEPVPGMTDPKQSDQEFILELKNGSREHHRIYDQGSRFKVESHIDEYSPSQRPISHLTNDVIAPELNDDLRKENFNDTQIIYVKKKEY